MMPYRVLIVDDHPLARQAVRDLLEDDPAMDIVGEAAGGEQALALCDALLPDLVLMDIRMPGMNGLETLKRIKQKHASVKIVILTVSDATADLFTAIQYGAQGYLLKSMEPAVWLDYLHALLKDDAESARRMADLLYVQFKTGGTAGDPEPGVLTAREREIVGLVANGHTNKQIADVLSISENTVKNHIKNALEKLQFENRVQLAAYAVKHGLSHNRP